MFTGSSCVYRPARLPVWLFFLAAMLLLVSCGENSSESGVIELQIGTVTAPGSLVSASSEEFARRINERLEGRVRVEFFGSSQLGNDEVLVQKLKLGTLDFAVPSTIMSSLVDEFGLFEMPYLVRDRDHMRRIGEEIFWPSLAPAAEVAGYRVLGLWENGFRHITNNTRPIYTPEDLSGIKLRTPRGEWRFKLFRVFGANPTPMPLAEVFVALQTGVIDGQENPFAQLASLKFRGPGLPVADRSCLQPVVSPDRGEPLEPPARRYPRGDRADGERDAGFRLLRGRTYGPRAPGGAAGIRYPDQ